MKKTFVAMCALFACVTIYASTEEPDKSTITSTYYGAEASNNPNNPCKGPTIRKCAEFTTSIESNGDDQTTVVTEQVKNSEGEVLSTTSYFVPLPPEVVKENLKMEAIASGATVEENAE